MITLHDVVKHPDTYSQTLQLSSGEVAVFRPLKPEDNKDLARFLEKLSLETRRFSTFQSYDIVTAKELCDAIDRYDKLRFVLQLSSNNEIIGLFEFSFDLPSTDIERFDKHGVSISSTTDCRFGPTLSDKYQNRGVGSLIFPNIIDVAKKFDKRRIVLFGGVFADNVRAIHFYKKNGFTKIGEFKNSDNLQCLDMIKVL